MKMKIAILCATLTPILAACGGSEPVSVAPKPTVAATTTTTAKAETTEAAAAPTTPAAANTTEDTYLTTCNEVLPLFQARAQFNAPQADQDAFAEAMLQHLQQSPEWATQTPADQAAAEEGVHAAARGQC